MAEEDYFEYVGNLHIHSASSDGGSGPKEIARAGRKLGLDFLILNDHSYLTGLHLEDEGYHRGVLLLVGSEIGTGSHHYLAFDIRHQVKSEGRSPQDVIDAVNRQGGFGFIAHPFEKGMPFLENSVTFTWDDWSVKGYTGICIWNFTSRWKENVKTLWHGIFHLLFKRYTLKGPSGKTLALWDSLCSGGKVVAIGGSDAHGAPINLGPLRFRPLRYEFLLNTINAHILTAVPLTGNLNADKETIYDSLRQGRCFMAHDGLYPAYGFRFFFAGEKDKKIVSMGEEKVFELGTLTVNIPEHGMIKIMKDGNLFKAASGSGLSLMIRESGVYRAEVWKKTTLFGWRPWIFSNPVYLR